MCRHHSALTEARNVSDMDVSTDAPQVDGMAAPVLSNFVVGVVVDRARKMSSMFVGVFLLFRIPFRGGWSSAVFVVVGGDSPSKKKRAFT
jgi:hypothetical protein